MFGRRHYVYSTHTISDDVRRPSTSLQRRDTVNGSRFLDGFSEHRLTSADRKDDDWTVEQAIPPEAKKRSSLPNGYCRPPESPSAVSKSFIRQLPKTERRSSSVFTDQTESPGTKPTQNGSDFLVQYQCDLDAERSRWNSELGPAGPLHRPVRQMSRTVLVSDSDDGNNRDNSILTMSTANATIIQSHVDDSVWNENVFKTAVDLSQFTSPSSVVNVRADSRTSKIVIEASAGLPDKNNNINNRTLTQRVQMPRFADETRMKYKLKSDGILEIEVPLVYYFPRNARSELPANCARSYIYGIRADHRDPSLQVMEIIVEGGQDFLLTDLHVQVDGDRLTISAEQRATCGRRRLSSSSQSQQTNPNVIKQYTLPPMADVDQISSRRNSDGQLIILVPIRSASSTKSLISS